jgi:elongation factor Tu
MREIIARLSLLTTAEGGRRTPFMSGYRPAFYVGELQTDGAIELLDRSQQAPGETANVRLKLLHPENFGELLEVGVQFEVREGPNTIGQATVIEIPDL